MRAPSFLRRPFVLALGLGLFGVFLLWLLAPRFEAWVYGLDPWTPPALAVSGIPAEPTQALQALEVHGDVPACHPREQIEVHSSEEGEDDHEHVYVPVEPLPMLEGHAEEILPYLGHPSEPVVHRAASLLCFIQDWQSRRALAWLATHYPCRYWVTEVLAGVGMPWMGATCRPEAAKGGYDLLAELPPGGSKPSPEALALAQRISQGDSTAVRQALLATQSMDLAQRPDGVQALMNVSTPQGLALVLQANFAEWEAKVLSASTNWFSPRMHWEAKAFLKGVGGAALRSVVERTGRSQEAVLVEAVGLMPMSLVRRIHGAVSEDRPLYFAIGRFARSPAGQEVTAATAREFMERINRETAGRDPQEIEAESKRITALFQAGDVMALKQVATSASPHAFHPMLAACYLAGLGEEELALGMLEKMPSLSLQDGNAIRSEVKRLLDRAKPGATRERLERIYAKSSEYCHLNDCSDESPR